MTSAAAAAAVLVRGVMLLLQDLVLQDLDSATHACLFGASLFAEMHSVEIHAERARHAEQALLRPAPRWHRST